MDVLVVLDRSGIPGREGDAPFRLVEQKAESIHMDHSRCDDRGYVGAPSRNLNTFTNVVDAFSLKQQAMGMPPLGGMFVQTPVTGYSVHYASWACPDCFEIVFDCLLDENRNAAADYTRAGQVFERMLSRICEDIQFGKLIVALHSYHQAQMVRILHHPMQLLTQKQVPWTVVWFTNHPELDPGDADAQPQMEQTNEKLLYTMNKDIMRFRSNHGTALDCAKELFDSGYERLWRRGGPLIYPNSSIM
jgi:hypothetical protein